MLFEILERFGGVRESGPVANGAAIGDALLVGGRDAPFLGEAFVDNTQEIPVEHRRRLSLLRRLMARMSLQNFVPRESPVRRAGEGLEGFDHPAFPVDQSSVTVE